MSSEKPKPEPNPASEPQDSRYKRNRLQRIPFVPVNVPPAKDSINDAELLPEVSANILDLITFGWITHLLAVGYARPLEASDLYKLPDHCGAALIGDKISASFDRRTKEANDYNERLENGSISPGWRRKIWWTLRGNRAQREKQWREKDGRRRPSLVWAMNDSVKWWFWSGGLLKVVGDTAQVTSPLLVKAIINFAKDSYTGHFTGAPVPAVGKGIGLTFGLLALQLVASLCTHHFFYRSSSTGVLLRGGLITAIYSRSLRLTARARSKLTNGLIMNHISTDVSRIDFCAGFFHMAWAAPIQMCICLALLILQLGPSALAGFGFFFIATPLQTLVMKSMFAFRKNSMVWTDKRAKLLQELLGGMKVIKFFAWEIPFLKRITDYRHQEIKYIRSLLLTRSANNAVALSLPTLASVVAFVTYSLSGHDLQPDKIFTSLTLFNLLRMPLMFLPMAFSAIVDAKNATNRLYAVFEAETLSETRVIDDGIDNAIEVKNASFTWDAPPPVDDSKKMSKAQKRQSKRQSVQQKRQSGAVTPRPSTAVDAEKDGATPPAVPDVFKMTNVSLTVPKGKFVAIVGAVGSGKSSLLQGLIGEMRRTSGTVTFGGSVGYCPQSAWIQNATVRENICFGRPFDEERYWKAVKDSCLEPDLDMLPNGDLTEVGEKGISLSGGQKQRLNICRAIYCDTDIQIFDDPLSALDAHVGKAVFNNVLLNAPPTKTRVLVTHALHFLPQVDYIYAIANGRIAEQGTYDELMRKDQGEFAKFVREFGSQDQEVKKVEAEQGAIEDDVEAEKKRKNAVAGVGMMQAEERNTGAIGLEIYKAYLNAGYGFVVLPVLLASIALVQGSNVMSSYWLVYWQELEWPRSQGFYMGVYASLGVSQAVAFFLMGSSFATLTYFASQRLHKNAIQRVMHAPMSFFETTPLGRIMNRFSKDIDTVDNLLGESLRMMAGTASQILGAIILISIILPWFLIAVFSIMILYAYAAAFYRASARELKRLDAVLRSTLYSHFSESLTGLSTIRAYGETERFRRENKEKIDIENRAYWITVTNQRWLGIRVDFMGAVLTFMVAILTVASRFSISPSQTGVTLSYILTVQQSFGWLVRQLAEVENNMNSVERIVHYANEIEQEATYSLPPPPLSPSGSPWPNDGAVELRDVVLKYRPELPPVLKGISMSIGAGEKIGIVGRTGAGKSSIMTALYRIVELSAGSIAIDGQDIAKLGLKELRDALSIIPQDPLLFSGTLRSNLDPFNLHDDAKLWDALRRSYLVSPEPIRSSDLEKDAEAGTAPPSGTQTPGSPPKFTLDSIIEEEGGNISLGQRSLVSLARALVKDTKILILDEATASVDYETDRNIQETIATEFKDRTILCIAHRLRTILSYDRICVLDSGSIAEFDTPINLFQKHDGIFKGMCDGSGIGEKDIVQAQREK